MPDRRSLAETYRIPVIWGACLGLLAIGLVCGLILGRFAGAGGVDLPPEVLLESGTDFQGQAVTVRDVIADHAQDPEGLLAIATYLQREADRETREAGIDAWPRGEEAAGIGVVESIGPIVIAHQGTDVPPTLATLAGAEPPPRWANHAVGLFLDGHGRPGIACEAYAREGERFEAARSSRKAAVLSAISGQRESLLAAWRQDPAWADAWDPHVHYQRAADAGDWGGVVRWLLPMLYHEIDAGMVAIALVAGLGYLAFLWHGTHGGERRRELLLLCCLGVGLGVVSTWLTIVALTVEEYLGWGLGTTAFDQALYCFAGIGLREELTKLICFLPLIPWLLRRHGPLAWLVVASCVGLGFAIEENVNYYTSSAGSAVAGRFLTANFLHLALTGMVGHALCCGLRWPATHLAHAGSVFVIAVIAHGAYDAFLIVDALETFSWAYFIVFVLIGNAYFQSWAHLRPAERPRVSLTMIFCCALCLTLAVAYATLSLALGAGHAAHLLVPSSLTSAIVIVMYVRGIGDRLTA